MKCTLGGMAIAPAGVTVRNPAFDDPGGPVTGIITERGCIADRTISMKADWADTALNTETTAA